MFIGLFQLYIVNYKQSEESEFVKFMNVLLFNNNIELD